MGQKRTGDTGVDHYRAVVKELEEVRDRGGDYDPVIEDNLVRLKENLENNVLSDEQLERARSGSR